MSGPLSALKGRWGDLLEAILAQPREVLAVWTGFIGRDAKHHILLEGLARSIGAAWTSNVHDLRLDFKGPAMDSPGPAWLHFGREFIVFVKGLEIGHFWGLGGPGGSGDPPGRWGASPPTFLKGPQGLRGHPDPKTDRFPTLDTLQNFSTKPKCSHE